MCDQERDIFPTHFAKFSSHTNVAAEEIPDDILLNTLSFGRDISFEAGQSN